MKIKDLVDGDVGTGLLPDWVIAQLPIFPIAPMEKRPGKISFGCSSYGYDARLGDEGILYHNAHGGVVDPKNVSDNTYVQLRKRIDDTGEYFLIPPGGYVLCETLEWFEIPRDVTCLCLGKSTYARTGLIVNATPLEAGWKGKVTLEISNANVLPAKIYIGEGIVQILFFRCAADCDVSYDEKNNGAGGIYQNQKGTTPPRVIGESP